jgi:SAM-dependent methyltransferase
MAESVPSVGNLRFYLDYLFRDVELADSRMLDVGAASAGRYSFYAACSGAAEVVALQAHDEGSTAGTAAEFDTTAGRLGLENARFVASSLPESNLDPAHFDVVLLYASINHLDEDACVRLERDPEARALYLELLGELARVAAPGATLIAVDCSSRNLFARFGKNPLAPGIEWEKHHPPELWVRLLEEAGFTRPKIRWNSVNTLRTPGRVLLGNRFAAYCLASVFCLTMERA